MVICPVAPHWLSQGQQLGKTDSTRARLCGTHISETVAWIYNIWSSMELFRPVVVQHHGYLTLALDCQGQMFRILHIRNMRADSHGTKGMWVDRMLDPHCDFEVWPHLRPRHLFIKVSFFRIVISQEHGNWIWVDRMLYKLCDLVLSLWPWIWRSNFKKEALS